MTARPPITLSPLGPENAAEYWGLRLQCFRENPTYFGDSYEELHAMTLSQMRRELANIGRCPDDFVLGAWVNEMLVGCQGLRRDPRQRRRHRALIYGLYVLPELRRRGIGRALAVAALDRARQIPGLEAVNGLVLAHNEPSLALRRSLGFVDWGRERGALRVDGVDYDEILMGLKL